jgi:hypothetical protein
MTILDVLATIGGICSLLMVCGSMFLLYKGILTFQDANPSEAIKAEFQKLFNIQTRYPAIALFVVGVIFLAVSLYYASTEHVLPVEVSGDIKGGDPDSTTLYLTDELGEAAPDSHGHIQKQVWPKIELIRIRIATPGYAPGEKHASAIPDKGHPYRFVFEPIEIGPKLKEQLNPDPSQLSPTPAPTVRGTPNL